MNSQEIENSNKIQLHFIIGSARSGTSLLTKLLNNHENCIAFIELKHVLLFYKKYKDSSQITPILIRDYAKFIYRKRPSKKYNLNEVEMKLTNFLPIGSPINYATLSKFIFLLYGLDRKNSTDVHVMVDKNHFYTFHTQKLLEIFPDSKFIISIRDYRAVVLSNIQSHDKKWRFVSLFFYAYSWKKYNEKIHLLMKKHPEKCLLIKYEELVGENKKPVLNQCLDFLALNHQESVFNFNKEGLNPIKYGICHDTLRQEKIKTALSQPINDERTNSWKTELSKRKIEKIEFIAATIGKQFLYEPITHVSMMKRRYLFFCSIPSRIILSVYYKLNSIRLDYVLNQK